MDYQQINGVTKAIGELTAAVQVPASVSVSVVELGKLVDAVSSNHDIIVAACISAVAVGVTAIVGWRSNVNLSNGHAKEVDILNEQLKLQREQFEAEQKNKQRLDVWNYRKEGYSQIFTSVNELALILSCDKNKHKEIPAKLIKLQTYRAIYTEGKFNEVLGELHSAFQNFQAIAYESKEEFVSQNEFDKYSSNVSKLLVDLHNIANKELLT